MTGPDGQVVTGTDTPTLFNVSYHIGAAEVHGGTGSDTISYVNATIPATIDLGAGTAQSSNGTITFTSIENATGSALGNDSITGDDGANVLGRQRRRRHASPARAAMTSSSAAPATTR